MSETQTIGSPFNHAGHDNCNGALPLTLADRERIHGRLFRQHYQTPDWHEVFCARCLADLPHGFAALFHVCEDELLPVCVGDVVQYHGSLAEYQGSVWEVTQVDARGRLCLFDVDRAMSRVHPGSVTVLQKKSRAS